MDKNKPHHILVIRLSAMGDVAMLVPVLSCLTATYPLLKISLLTKAQFAPIFSSFSNVTIIKADVKGKHKGVLGLFKLYKALKKLDITMVADVHNVLRSTILKIFFRTSNVPFVQINKGRKEKAALTRAKNKVFKQLKTTYQRYADVFKELDFPIDLTKVKLLEKASLYSKIEAVTGKKEQNWIGIAPFAAHEGKMYPLDLMKEVISGLVKEKNNKVLLFGGGDKEVDLLKKMQDGFGHKVINCAGKLSFKEELALISNLDCMLSMDSGNGHLAANYNVPVITLWGVTHPFAGFAPFGQAMENALLADRRQYPLIPASVYGNTMPEDYENVMTTILPDAVCSKISELLNRQ